MHPDKTAKHFKVELTVSLLGSPYSDEEIQRRLTEALSNFSQANCDEVAGSVIVDDVRRQQ